MIGTIVVFSRDSVSNGTFLSFWPVSEMGKEYGFDELILLVGSESLIERSRSILSTRFFDNDEKDIPDLGDVLMMVDNDIRFNASDLLRVMRTAVELKTIVAGPYFMREFPPRLPCVGFKRKENFRMFTGLKMMRWVATGFMAIPRGVLNDMAENSGLIRGTATDLSYIPFFKTIEIDDPERGHVPLSEDFSFCHRANELGYYPLLDTNVLLFHVGNYEYSILDLQKFGNAHSNKKEYMI